MGEVAEFLLPALQAGDMVITLGAGDIWRVGEELLHRLEESS
jgi:UDP-N-acetylmuramate--alanine ligase